LLIALQHSQATIPLPWAYVIQNGYAFGTVYYGAFINSLIHCLMYSHYLAASFGVRNPLKRYLTSAQIMQFFSCVLHAVLFFYFEKTNPISSHLQLGYHIIMIVLFCQFYFATYGSSSGAAAAAAPKTAAAAAAAEAGAVTPPLKASASPLRSTPQLSEDEDDKAH
jgi:hypothetical protein